MAFVVETIKMFCYVFFSRESDISLCQLYSGIVAAVSHDKHERPPPHSCPSKNAAPDTKIQNYLSNKMKHDETFILV